MNAPCPNRRRPWFKRSPAQVGLSMLILSSICCRGVTGRPYRERFGMGDRPFMGGSRDGIVALTNTLAAVSQTDDMAIQSVFSDESHREGQRSNRIELGTSHTIRGQHQKKGSSIFAIPSGSRSIGREENINGSSGEYHSQKSGTDIRLKTPIITRQLYNAALSTQYTSELSTRKSLNSRELSTWGGGDSDKPKDEEESFEQEDDEIEYEREEGTHPPDSKNEDNFENAEERKAEDDFYGSEPENSLDSEIIAETLPFENELANNTSDNNELNPHASGETSEGNTTKDSSGPPESPENEESHISKPENLSGTSEEEENAINQNSELPPSLDGATATPPGGEEEAGVGSPVGESIPTTTATDVPMESKHPETPESISGPESTHEEGASESVALNERQPSEESLQELEEEEEEEKEKEEILQEELSREEREVRRIGGFGVFLAIVAMIFTAHQMSENPDGIYASCCRLIITLVSCGFKMVFMPFRSAVGGNRGYGHLPVSSDYGYRDPYRPGASSGGAMELS